MKKEITLANLLGILITPFLLILSWGISVTSRLETYDEINTETKKNIEKLDVKIDKTNDRVDENYKILVDKIDQILYKLDEKETRK